MSNETPLNSNPARADSLRAIYKIFWRAISSLIILILIAFLTLTGLYLAEQGRHGLPAEPGPAVRAILSQLFTYLTDHPRSYIWHKEIVPAFTLVFDLFRTSAGLLSISLLFAALFGTAAGIQAALSRRNISAPIMLIISILGISTPSFLLAMLLWVLNLSVSRAAGLGHAPLPPTGFGWDSHLILPALVLAARPFAQIMQVTYVNMSAILNQDFIRAVRAKGGSQRYLIIVHALPNILIPVLTTLTTSLRFSLASLPVIETIFIWPGLGLAILQAITLEMPALVTDLTISLGLMFLILNFILEMVYPLIDPRLRVEQVTQEIEPSLYMADRFKQVSDAFSTFSSDISALFLQLKLKILLSKPEKKKVSASGTSSGLDDPPPYHSERKQIIWATLTNFPLILGVLTVIGLAVLAIWGAQLTAVNPYTNRNVMMIQGKVYGPPFNPSTTFPWGSDLLGRDIQALVLAGARQTLVLAFLTVIARLLVGTILGLAIGWWQNSWFDRLILGLMAVWSAFPVTIFTAILILGLGIQRGIGIFIFALCLVGWGEITQYIRSKVIAQKPSLYIEAARSVGARTPRILFRHILPNLLPDILVLGALEMGGVLMLLAELGFLNIFLGGGFRVEMLEGTIYNYSDVPEWGALLANIRNLWRSYPWVAWSPGLAFFVSILGFNLLGEGLRRFLEESRFTISRLVNRYTLMVLVGLIFGLSWMVQTSAPIGLYQQQARTFDASRASQDIAQLASPVMEGRESGTPGSKKAAEYIASRMAEIGLSPAGSGDTYLQELSNTNYHLTAMPAFKILDSQDNPVETLIYRQDFVENSLVSIPGYGQGKGQVMGLAVGNGSPEFKQDIQNLDVRGKIIIVSAGDSQQLPRLSLAGMLVISDDPSFLNRRYLTSLSDSPTFPVLIITPELGDRLLKTAGSSLAELDTLRHDMEPNQLAATRPGVSVSIWFPFEPINLQETCQNVIGYIPGSGAQMGDRRGAGLDNQVILLSAYFDGLGVGPDGTLYPGANDNASSVATLLEVARVLKNGPYQPKKTIVFAAWCGGERQEGFSVVNIMNAKIGFNQLEVEAVLELTGLAQGDGRGITLGSGTSYRLNQLIVKAAGRLGISVTTRGRDTHIDLPRGSGFGGRKALSAYLSWDGSDILAHTAEDRMEFIDPKKLQKSGELVSLIATVLSRETTY